jgi:hypothetical protein
MPTYSLSYRITDFLNRQIAWSTSVLAELDAFDAAQDEGMELLLNRQRQREQEAGDMAREYHGLAQEWASERDVSEEDRTAIRVLSEEAQALSNRVQESYRYAQKNADDGVERTGVALNDLRQRRRSVTIYHPEMIVTPGFIDKKA